MQNRYAGDVGDFSKFVLLRALASDDLRPAVVWYLNPAEEANGDGRHTNYSHVHHLCPEIAARLTDVLKRGDRTVAALESANIVPLQTIYFSEPLPVPSAALDWRDARCRRAHWLSRALSAVETADIVLLDPDNGLAPPSVTKSSKSSLKYAFPDEVLQFADGERTLILYQHLPRMTVEACYDQVAKRLHLTNDCWSISFHALSTRLYIVMPSARHKSLLRHRTLQLTQQTSAARQWWRRYSEGAGQQGPPVRVSQ